MSGTWACWYQGGNSGSGGATSPCISEVSDLSVEYESGCSHHKPTDAFPERDTQADILIPTDTYRDLDIDVDIKVEIKIKTLTKLETGISSADSNTGNVPAERPFLLIVPIFSSQGM